MMVNNGNIFWIFKNGGIPKWMVYFMENPDKKWMMMMMTGGSPIHGNLHITLHSTHYTRPIANTLH